MNDILLIGDSLTEWNYENGWGKQMCEWYKNKANVVNCGYAGYNSQMIKNDISMMTSKYSKPILCTIFLGTNDCYNFYYWTSPDQYKRNIIQIIQHIRNLNNNCVILLITPPVCIFSFNVMDYVFKLREIATQLNVGLVDLHYHGPYQILYHDLYDGIHFNDRGNRKMFENVKKTILEYFHTISPDAINLNNNNIPDSFDWKRYISIHPDLYIFTNKEDAWDHWINYGKPEGRRLF